MSLVRATFHMKIISLDMVKSNVKILLQSWPKCLVEFMGQGQASYYEGPMSTLSPTGGTFPKEVVDYTCSLESL